MKAKIGVLTLVAVSAVLTFAALSAAQQSRHMQSPEASSSCGWSGGCALGRDPAAWEGDPKMHDQMMGMMHGMGMTDAMMRHSSMMMHAPMSPGNPACLLGLKDDLKLSAEQVSKLEDIAKQAQEQALGVLTDEQRNELKTLPSGPMTMHDMWRDMDHRMQEWHGQHPNDPVVCPYHMMMMHGIHQMN